jgi:hypothetical protein
VVLQCGIARYEQSVETPSQPPSRQALHVALMVDPPPKLLLSSIKPLPPFFSRSRPRQHLEGAIKHPPTPAEKDKRRKRSERIARSRNTRRREGTGRQRTGNGTSGRNRHRRRVFLRGWWWCRQARRSRGRRHRRRVLRGRWWVDRRRGKNRRGGSGEDGAGGEGEDSQKGSGTKGRGCHSLSSSSSL